MNKLQKIVAVATLCCVSGITAASDRSLAIAWTGAGESIAKLAATGVARDVASLVSKAASWFAPGEDVRRALPAAPLHESELDPAKSGACQLCPEPPC